MHLPTVLNVLGRLVLMFGALMTAPLVVSMGYAESNPGANEPFAFLIAMIVTVALGAFLRLRFQRDNSRFSHREGFAIVTLGWVTLSICGSIPYLLVGGTAADGSALALGPVDAFFETVSGLTTTGSTILPDIEAYGHGLLFWRSMTQWIGGMGIVVLTVAILPSIGAGGYQLVRAEIPGPTADKIAPRIAQTAKILWTIYLGLTFSVILLLWAPSWFGPSEVTGTLEPSPAVSAAEGSDSGVSDGETSHNYRSRTTQMDLYESVLHAFTTVATGGFSPRNGSMAAFSPYHQWVVIVFMFLSGVNFLLHWQLIMGRAALVAKNSELRVYASTVGIAALLVALGLVFLPVYESQGHGDDRGWPPVETDSPAHPEPPPTVEDDPPHETDYETAESTIRHALFQVLAIMTTTGYATSDYDGWPDALRLLLVILMVTGACAGSTSGSLKIIRVMVIAKHAFTEVRRLIFPHEVNHVRVGGERVPDRVVGAIIGAFTFYLLLLLVGALILSVLPGFDLETAFTASMTTISNVGPGMSGVGPTEHFGWIDPVGKVVCSFLMLLGRLEIYTVLVLLYPAMYRR